MTSSKLAAYNWGTRSYLTGWSALRIHKTIEEAAEVFHKRANDPYLGGVRLYDLRKNKYPKLEEFVLEYERNGKDPPSLKAKLLR